MKIKILALLSAAVLFLCACTPVYNEAEEYITEGFWDYAYAFELTKDSPESSRPEIRWIPERYRKFDLPDEDLEEVSTRVFKTKINGQEETYRYIYAEVRYGGSIYDA